MIHLTFIIVLNQRPAAESRLFAGSTNTREKLGLLYSKNVTVNQTRTCFLPVVRYESHLNEQK